MKVHPIDHGHNVHRLTAPTRTHQQAAHARKTDLASPSASPAPAPPSDTAPEQVTPPTPDERDSRAVPGVVRLLEAGHFRGVADVRLRINFFDELSARTMASAQPVIQDRSRELIETVSGELNQLLDGLAVDESARREIDELVGAFEASVQAAIEEFTGDGAIDRAALSDAARSAFDALVERLGELLATPVPEPEPQPTPDATAVAAGKDPFAAPVVATADQALSVKAPDSAALETASSADLTRANTPTQVVPGRSADARTDDPVDEPNATFQDALASLTEAFDAALASLLKSIESAMQLPDPSPPNGNGVAYAKFLAIYNELRGLARDSVDELA